MWKMWKTYPQRMWKTHQNMFFVNAKKENIYPGDIYVSEICGECGKLIHRECGKLIWGFLTFRTQLERFDGAW